MLFLLLNCLGRLLFMFRRSLLFWRSNNFSWNLFFLLWFFCRCWFCWWFFINSGRFSDYRLFIIRFFSSLSFIYDWSFRSVSWRQFMIYFILAFVLLFLLMIIFSLFFLMFSSLRLNWIFFITDNIFIRKICYTGSTSNSCGWFRLDIFGWICGSVF